MCVCVFPTNTCACINSYSLEGSTSKCTKSLFRLLCLKLFERVREGAQAGKGSRGKKRILSGPHAGCVLGSGPEPKSRGRSSTDWATQEPPKSLFLRRVTICPLCIFLPYNVPLIITSYFYNYTRNTNQSKNIQTLGIFQAKQVPNDARL